MFVRHLLEYVICTCNVFMNILTCTKDHITCSLVHLFCSSIKLGPLSPVTITNGMDIYNFSFNCLGHETRLSNCVNSTETCHSRTAARVDCSFGE